jgi:hypothetical protein
VLRGGGAKEDLVTNHGTYGKSNIEARLYGVKALAGDLGFWFDYAFSKGGNSRMAKTFRRRQAGQSELDARASNG